MGDETLGQRLKRLRERAGLTQAQLAAAADIPVGTVRGAEYDRREPLVTTAGKLACALGVSLDELVSGAAVAPKTPGAKKAKAADAAEGPPSGQKKTRRKKGE